jgi:hypothetical protein
MRLRVRSLSSLQDNSAKALPLIPAIVANFCFLQVLIDEEFKQFIAKNWHDVPLVAKTFYYQL